MILRTPPQRKRRADSDLAASGGDSGGAGGRLVIYEDSSPVAAVAPDMVCTYNCRQMVKSEFMGALSSAEKQVHDYQSTLEKLNDELQKAEDERKEYRDQLCFVEQELAASKGREHALQERLLKEVDDAQERFQIQLKECSDLQVRLKKEAESRKNAESSATPIRDKVTDLEEKLRLSESREREKDNLKREIAYLKDESKLSVSRINADLEKMTVRAESSEKESELLKRQLEDMEQKLSECLRQKRELEHNLSRQTAPTHEINTSEAETLVKHLQEELRNYEAEVLEARKLKSSYQNIELLREKFSEEKLRREKAETELSKLQEVEQNANKLEHELMAWKSLLNDIPDVSCSDDIPKKFAGLQKETIENMMKVGEVNARCKELELALELADLSKQHAVKESALAKERAENSVLEVKRLELLVKSVTEERERQRKDAMQLNKQSMQSSGLVDDANESLIKDMESSLVQRESSIRDLESTLLKQREIIDHQCDELKLMHEKLSTEARRVKSLEREGDRLRSEISLLESKLGHGDYSAKNTKVLRMVNTLAVDDEAKHTIDALQIELQKAQAKLQAVEELKGQSVAGNLIDADIPEKLAHLKKQIAILEKREERYKAVFAEKISVFRKACCSLFGYKIVMDDQQRPNGIPVTRFTLQSIFAQSDDEILEFDYESGSANILANDYTSQPEISHQIQIFIKNMNSIPAFTANLTIESFNKRTLS